MPFRQQDEALKLAFVNFIVHSENTRFMAISEQTGLLAAELRGRYNLGLPDALQVATAIETGCDAFLSNDKQLKRISELKVLVLDELTV